MQICLASGRAPAAAMSGSPHLPLGAWTGASSAAPAGHAPACASASSGKSADVPLAPRVLLENAGELVQQLHAEGFVLDDEMPASPCTITATAGLVRSARRRAAPFRRSPCPPHRTHSPQMIAAAVEHVHSERAKRHALRCVGANEKGLIDPWLLAARRLLGAWPGHFGPLEPTDSQRALLRRFEDQVASAQAELRAAGLPVRYNRRSTAKPEPRRILDQYIPALTAAVCYRDGSDSLAVAAGKLGVRPESAQFWADQLHLAEEPKPKRRRRQACGPSAPAATPRLPPPPPLASSHGCARLPSRQQASKRAAPTRRAAPESTAEAARASATARQHLGLTQAPVPRPRRRRGRQGRRRRRRRPRRRAPPPPGPLPPATPPLPGPPRSHLQPRAAESA